MFDSQFIDYFRDISNRMRETPECSEESQEYKDSRDILRKIRIIIDLLFNTRENRLESLLRYESIRLRDIETNGLDYLEFRDFLTGELIEGDESIVFP